MVEKIIIIIKPWFNPGQPAGKGRKQTKKKKKKNLSVEVLKLRIGTSTDGWTTQLI
jgi:hypothetical protein